MRDGVPDPLSGQDFVNFIFDGTIFNPDNPANEGRGGEPKGAPFRSSRL